ncbi:hypothetical protein [Streptomyces lateritius]|uniref:hypothetical protein n=1 Tax=Streptomyces lateritius TaxID=67313 RepID=UPI001996CD47|nr:hypothetical protein [Streptomyces lateritius]GGU01524.1 hypothetical protein GCM10010272_53250 [Streptomyces lateritius]
MFEPLDGAGHGGRVGAEQPDQVDLALWPNNKAQVILPTAGLGTNYNDRFLDTSETLLRHAVA